MSITADHDHLADTTYLSERFSECTRCGALIDWEDEGEEAAASPSRLPAFRRHVLAAAGYYQRLDAGLLTGRNGSASADTLDWHVREATAALLAAARDDADPLPEYLDTRRGARLAATWSAVERRHAGLR